MYSTSENIQAFSSTRSLVAYARLSPQHRLSGTSIHHRPRLSKIGNPHLRKALDFPAINARRFNPTIRAREDAESLKSEWGRPFLDVRWQVLCARLIQKMNYPR